MCLKDAGAAGNEGAWGGNRTTAQKLHLGCRQKEENDPAAAKHSFFEEIHWLSTGINVCNARHATSVGFISIMLSQKRWCSALRLR